MKSVLPIAFLFCIILGGFFLYDKTKNRFNKQEAIELFNVKLNSDSAFFNDFKSWVLTDSLVHKTEFSILTLREEQVIAIDYTDRSHWAPVNNDKGIRYYGKFHNHNIRSAKIELDGTITFYFNYRDDDLNWLKLSSRGQQTHSKEKWSIAIQNNWFLMN